LDIYNWGIVERPVEAWAEFRQIQNEDNCAIGRA